MVAIFNGVAEACFLSQEVYMAMDPETRPPLHPSSLEVRGAFGTSTHRPIGELTLTVTIPELHLKVD